MRELILVGASGLARETLALLSVSGSHRVIGVVDDGAARWGTEISGVPVIGGLDAIAEHPRAEIAVWPEPIYPLDLLAMLEETDAPETVS